MDGVLVDNMRIHARAYDIFYERHGDGNRQNVLKELSGLGNDEIMQRLFTPRTARRTRRLAGAQRGEGRRSTANPTNRSSGRPPDCSIFEALRREGIACAVGSSAEMRKHPFRLREVRHRVLLSDRGQQRAGHALQTRSGDIPQSGRKGWATRPEECVVFEDARAGIEAGDRAGMKVVALATTLNRAKS